MSAPQVLRDRRADARLRRDGFVVLPGIEPQHAERLRARHNDLRGEAGTGFVPDLVVPDFAYRDEASAYLAGELDDIVSGWFCAHAPFLRNFLCKYPGPDSGLYLHQDWMYVDERRGGRTCVVWIALDDVTGDNGQLQVARGSHRVGSMVRGTDLVAPWIDEEDVLRPRLLSVPLRLGQAVVMDNALVHCSYPNHSDRPRLAVGMGMRPTADPLVYFRREGDQACRYDVEPSFFLRALPQELFATPPDLPVAERVPVGDHALAAAELARRLDRGALAKLDRVERWWRRRGHEAARSA